MYYKLKRINNLLHILLGLLITFTILTCSDEDDEVKTSQTRTAPAKIEIVMAKYAYTDITSVILTVTGSDMKKIEADLSIDQNLGRATGSVHVPVGNNRTFSVEVYAGNNLRYFGKQEVNILDATSIKIPVKIKPAEGLSAISISEGSKGKGLVIGIGDSDILTSQNPGNKNLVRNISKFIGGTSRLKLDMSHGSDIQTTKIKELESSLRENGFNVNIDESPEYNRNSYDAVLIALPTNGFSLGEINSIKQFVNNNGTLILIADINSPLEPLNDVAKEFGLNFDYSLISLSGGDPGSILLNNFSSHPIFDGVTGISASYARSINLSPSIPDMEVFSAATPGINAIKIPDKPGLSIKPSALDFGESLQNQQVIIENTGTGNLTWRVDTTTPLPQWLSLSPLNGQNAAGEKKTVSISVDRQNVNPGNYNYTITIDSSAGDFFISITMIVPEQNPSLSISPASLDFGAEKNEDKFNITNIGGGTLIWNIESDLPNWLQASLMKGAASAGGTVSVILTVNRSNITPGSYRHLVKVTSNGGNSNVTVSMTVPEPTPKIAITPSSIDFETTKTEGTITVSNTGGGTLSWNIQSDLPSWLKASIMKGETLSGKPTSVVLSVSRQNINPGTYKHTVSFTSNGGNGSVAVSMTVPEPTPKITITPSSIDFETTKTEGTITVSNTGGGTLSWSIQSDLPSWLKASIMKGETLSGKPTSVVLSVSRQNINPGTYKHTVSFTSNGGNGSVAVSMTVPEPQPVLSFNPDIFDFGGSTTQNSLTISNTGGGTLTWQATKQQNWLTISPISGSLTSGKSVNITITVIRTGLNPGAYKDTISITSNGGNGSVAVNMTVPEPEKPPILSLKPTSINFGQTTTQSSFTISNTGGGNLVWQAAKQQNWLTVNPLNGSVASGNSFTVNVTVSRSGLAPGNYTDAISITSNGGNASISISISVPSPKLALNPASIDFGDKSTQSSVTISNTGGGTLSWRATKQSQWLTLSSASGTIISERSITITLTVSRTGLEPGTYNDTVSFTSNGGNINLPITMVVPIPPAVILVNPTTLNLGETNTQGSFTITNTGGETLSWKASNQQSWLTVNPSSGSVASGKVMNVSVNVSRADLNPGVYNDTISITSNGGNSSVIVSITVASPKLSINPVSIDFGEIAIQNSFNIANTGGGTLTWQATNQQKWITINPSSGSVASGKTTTVSLTVSRTGLNPGTYKDTIAISSNGGNGNVSISMTVPVPLPKLSLNPTTLSFGETTTQGTFTITNSGGQTLTWRATKQNNWLTLSSSSGSLAGGRSVNITVTVSRAGLNSGTYTDLIAITSNGGEGSVSVSMIVPSPKLSFNPVSIDFGEATAQSSITINNTGGGIMTWQMSKQQPWLTLSTTSGTLEAGKPLTILVSVSRTGLAPGTYTDNISITSNGGNGNIQVRMIVPQPLLSISPTTLNFGEKDTQKTFTITNAGGSSLDWSIEQTTEMPGWIKISSLKGSLSSQESITITVSVDRSFLDTGNYQGTIRISSNGGSGQVTVNMSVPQSILLLNPLSLDFGTTLTQQTFTITNNGGGFLEWQVSSRLPSWITSIDPNKGNLSAGSSTKVNVNISRTNMENGIYKFSILISSDGGNGEIQITMEVKAPQLNVNVRSLSFGAKTTERTLILSNTGGGTLTWNSDTSQRWISIYPSEGTITSGGNSSVSVTVSRDGLKPGDYSGTVFISSNGGNISIPVSMSVWLNVDPQFLDFGVQANNLSFTISNIGTGPITWTATSNVNWAVVNPAKGTTDPGKPTVVQVEVSRRLLQPRAQPYTGRITIISDSGISYVDISVTVPVIIIR